MKETTATITYDNVELDIEYRPSTPDTLDGLGDDLEVYSICAGGVEIYDLLSESVLDGIKESLCNIEPTEKFIDNEE